MSDQQVISTPHGAVCLACRYSLEHLTVARCPECGRAFDPGDYSTMSVPGYRKPPRVQGFREQVVRIAMLATVFGVVGLLGLPQPDNFLLVCPVVLWVSLLVAIMIPRDKAADEALLDTTPPLWQPFVRAWPRRVAIWIVLGLSMNVYVDNCPHAFYVSIPPLEWAFGKRCGNPRWYVPAPVYFVRWMVGDQ